MDPVRYPYRRRAGPHGNLQCFSYPKGPVGAHAGPTRVPYDTLTNTQCNWHNQNLQKSHTGLACSRTGAVGLLTAPSRAVHGLFTISKPVGARKLIMHALKLHGPRTGGQNSYGGTRGPYGSHEWTYDFFSNQPGNSPYGARAYDVTKA